MISKDVQFFFFTLVGWWYGVVGHLEACDGNHTYCHCHENGKFLFIYIKIPGWIMC